MTSTRLLLVLCGGMALLTVGTPLAAQSSSQAAPAPITSADLVTFVPREIGPAVTGGRIADVEADPANPSVIWVASASGGVWKSTNRGQSWTPLTDDLAVSAFGDIALAPSNTDIVYIGSGEQNNRQSTTWGNGVYRSDDGGLTWQHLGLDETRHIGKIEVHPTDPDVAWVAALGNLWAPGETRGVFRTTDGGVTWQKVLFVDEYTGAVDLVMDPTNPDVLYAATYQRLRRAWGFNGGGPGSGIYKTTDGGDSWVELTNGLPEGDKGRIGLALAHSDPRMLNALIEHPDASKRGTYRSEDGGASWTRVNSLNIRPMYYSEIFIDPTNADRVYTMATDTHRSEDGGRTFVEIGVSPTYDVGVHRDQHALWIDPNDPAHLYMGGDAGLHESYDYGSSWRKINNFAISQFYAIGVDMRSPYWVYGGLQDNHSFAGPNETRRWIGIVNDDWKQVGFGDGMYWQPSHFDTSVAFGTSNGGNYFRLDTRTGNMLDVSPRAGDGEAPYRFDWTSPVLTSKHDPGTVYVAGNRFFISRDLGSSWTASADLSRQIDRDTLQLMGVRGRDITISRNDGTSSFGEAVTLSESPIDPAVLWVGMDDGNLQVSRDAGRSWTEVSGNVPGLPAGTYVGRIVASSRAAGAAWAAFDAHRDGDFAPYLYWTNDFGASWTPMHDGLPEGSLLSLAEHPDNPDLVFVGSEHHLFVSTDAGASWAQMPNLPTTSYDDLVIHPRDRDLVIGTHGRGIWVLDDIEPLAGWNADTSAASAHLFSIADATLFMYWKDTSYRADGEYAGTNPRDGVEITYRLAGGEGDALLRVTNADGQVVRTLRVPASAGLHRVNWDLRWGSAEPELWAAHDTTDVPRPIEARGHLVAPGRYTVTLEARGASSARQLDILPDPLRPDLSVQDYKTRESFLNDVQQTITALDALGDQGRALQRNLQRVYASMTGRAVRQGTLDTPTETQRGVLLEAQHLLATAR